jgi:glucose/mannose-6-phosphate isomerase
MNRFEKNTLAFPEQLSLNSLAFFDLAALKKAKPDGIVICGMGGSGMPGTLLQNIAGYVNIDLPIVVWKDFGLPHLSFKKPLFIFVSFSGNTAETLSGLKLASRAKLKAIVTAGGAMLEQAEAEKLPRAVVPAIDMVPRQASGVLLYGILGILKSVFPRVSAPDLSDIIDPQPLAAIGNSLAAKLKNKIAIVCTPSNGSHIALLFKAQLTETGKTTTFCETYPEFNHNGIVGLDRKPKGLVALFPITQFETDLTKQLVSIESEVLARRGVTPITVSIPGNNPLEAAANAAVIAMWTGLALAKLHKIDPEKTETISEIKKILKEHELSNQ